MSNWDNSSSQHGLRRGSIYELYCFVKAGLDSKLPELHLEKSSFGKNVTALLSVKNALSLNYSFNATSIPDENFVQGDKFTCNATFGNMSTSASLDLYYGCMLF